MQTIFSLRWGAVFGVLVLLVCNPALAQNEAPGTSDTQNPDYIQPENMTEQRQVYIDENGDGFNDNTFIIDGKSIYNSFNREGNRIGSQLGRTEGGMRFRYLNESHFKVKGDTQNRHKTQYDTESNLGKVLHKIDR